MENFEFSLILSVADVQFYPSDSSPCIEAHGSTVIHDAFEPGRVAQSVTCLATDASLTADLGVASSIPALSHTFVEIDHGIILAVILLPSAE